MPLPLILLAALLPQGPEQADPWDLVERNVCSAWRVLGPFDSSGKDGLKIPFVRETEPPDPALDWQDPPQDKPFADAKVNDLGWLRGGDHCVAYLARTITAAADHEARLGLGFDDAAALWINEVEVFRRDTLTAASPDQQFVNIRLRRGENRVLLKIANKGGRFEFFFRLAGPATAGNRWGAADDGGADSPYRVSTVPFPSSLVLEVGGLQWKPDGHLLVCTRRGWIYEIHNPSETDAARLRWTIFADGLHEPLGMLLEPDGSLLVCQKPELTRLRDTDGDGRADRFETIAADWGMSGNYHEYVFGPVRDPQGWLWGTLNIGFPSGKGAQLKYRGSAFRVDPQGRFHITSYGLRSPNGLVTDDLGNVFYTDNQGEWMDVCRLALLEPRRWYGHDTALTWAREMPDFGWERERTLPAVWYPYHLMKSTSWPVFDRTGGKFGPYSGQLFVGDQNNALLVRTTLEQVGGVWQGCCYPFWQGFECGVNRLAFANDGVLYVGSTERGWGSVGPKSFGLQRLTYRGPTPFDLQEVKATADGFELRFTLPLGPQVRLPAQRIHIREYGYRHHERYGSDEYDSRQVEVLDARIAGDRRSVAVRTGPRNTGKVFHLQFRCQVTDERGRPPITGEAFYTLHRVPAPAYK
jgi:hypothetical protein